MSDLAPPLKMPSSSQILTKLEAVMNGKKKMTIEDLVGLLEAVNGNIAVDECRVKLANGVVIMLEDKKKTP